MTEDNHFGPRYPGVFDFTILFEQSILSFLPTVVFVFLVPFRVAALWNHERVGRCGRHLWLKMVSRFEFLIPILTKKATTASLASLQIALVALFAADYESVSRTSVAEPVIGLVESLTIAALSYIEHRNAKKPSTLLNGYLVLTIILDIALARTFWIRPGMTSVASVFTSSLALKAVLLVLEETPKRSIAGKKQPVKETSAGVISRGFFWWLNRMLLDGSRSILDIGSLQMINEKFETHNLSEKLEKKWIQGE